MKTSFRLHIDHLDNWFKDIWAVYTYSNKKYTTHKSNQITLLDVTLTLVGPGVKQPRAYLLGYGNVTRHRNGSVTILGGK